MNIIAEMFSNKVLVYGSIAALFFIIIAVILIKKVCQSQDEDVKVDIEKIDGETSVFDEIIEEKEKNNSGQLDLDSMIAKMQQDLDAKASEVVEKFETEQEEKSVISYQELMGNKKETSNLVTDELAEFPKNTSTALEKLQKLEKTVVDDNIPIEENVDHSDTNLDEKTTLEPVVANVTQSSINLDEKNTLDSAVENIMRSDINLNEKDKLDLAVESIMHSDIDLDDESLLDSNISFDMENIDDYISQDEIIDSSNNLDNIMPIAEEKTDEIPVVNENINSSKLNMKDDFVEALKTGNYEEVEPKEVVKEEIPENKFKATEFISPIFGVQDIKMQYPTVQNIKEYKENYNKYNKFELDEALNVKKVNKEIHKDEDFLNSLKEFRKNLE